MMIIRKARLEDLDSIHQIEMLSFNDGSYPKFVLRQLFDISQDYFLVAEEEDQVMGYALGNIIKNTHQGWVLSLGVHPEARGKKLGSLLTQQLMDILANGLSTEILLTVHPDNAAALKIYEALGFKATGTFDNYYNDHETRMVMKKKLIN